MTGTYNNLLVFLSIGIAIFASLTALSLAGRVRASRGRVRQGWLVAASIALGGGIWAMHFVAMLSFSMPGMPTSYDLTLTLLSLAIALAFTGGGFALMNWRHPTLLRTLGAGLLMGSGVLAMHYIGMAAMRMSAAIRYDPMWVAASIVIAIGAATAALWLAAREQKFSHRLVAAVVMGIAISGMHFAGMRAAVFTSIALTGEGHGASVDQTNLALLITMMTMLILLIGIGAARVERLLQGFTRREARIALRLKVADVLRERDTQQALEEVAALMGAHFGVRRAGYGQLDPLEDVFDYDVCWTDGTVPPLIGRFPASAFGVRIVSALNAGQTVVVDDLIEAEISADVRARATARDVKTRSILVVPFVRDGRLRTIVYLNDSAPRSWHREDIRFMEEIAERTRLVIERAAVEQQLRELNTALEARVEERTNELRSAQEALIQSQKMEAIGQLVSGLAHDFNNVLGAVVGAFDVIRRRSEDPDRVQRFAEAGLQAANRGAKLTAQLLAFSRSQRIELRPLLVCDVIEDVRDLVARTLGPLIRLNFALNPAPVPVLANATQIEMIVLNLAINARDAMPDGGELFVATAVRQITGDQEVADGEYVEIMVRDTGTGMDEDTLRRAFEPFFTTKPVGKGTGLGLAQIYGSARQLSGTVRIESKPGTGTTVRVFLPCTDQPPADLATERPSSPAIGQDTGTRSRVLLVDDDNDLRRMLAAALEAHGHEVTEAGSGAMALATLDSGLPDIAVLDFAMPGMNGAELARHLIARCPQLPIMFASGFADTDAIRAVMGDDVRMLHKPFRVDELLHAIDQTRIAAPR